VEFPVVTSPDPDLEVLARNVALARLVREDLCLVYEYLDQMVLPPGTTVVHEDDPGNEMYFILEGRATISRRGLELRALGPGDHFGELALLGFSRRAATVIADGPLRVARLDREPYLKL